FHVTGVQTCALPIFLRENLFKDFDEFEPGKMLNQTNGVTPRRWMLKCNPSQTALLNRLIGPGWERDAMRLSQLERFVDDYAVIEIGRASCRERVYIW